MNNLFADLPTDLPEELVEVLTENKHVRIERIISTGHASPDDVAAWWVKYLLPKSGVLLDCFAGSGTMLLAGLDFGASRVIGIDKQKKYLKIAKKRLCE